jgi:D-alanine-D-alanine ligase
MPSLRILHLIGSPVNDFYCTLSHGYAESCLWNTYYVSSLGNYAIAYITPDGRWRFPSSLGKENIDYAKPMSLSHAIEYIKMQNIKLVIPHMYCFPGMTHYRGLFDLLKIPYIGNTPHVMAIAADKSKTKAIVAAAGVKVPLGELLRQGDVATIPPPAIVKPVTADNSLGVTLVRKVNDYDAALKKAFEYGDEVIVEAFIEPGREVHCGCIVKDGQLIALPLEEYQVNAQDRPIRTYEDKFTDYSIDFSEKHWMLKSFDPITEKVQEMAKKCHLALGCRHYSLFEFRIDPDGEPWFLEACLYCSFGPGGGISGMAKIAGIDMDDLVMIMIEEAMKEI